jgi:hypothetical protein
MKSKVLYQIVLIAVVIVLGQGCAREQSAQTPPSETSTTNPTPPTTPSGGTNNPDPAFAAGAIADLTIDSLAAMNAYVATRPLNDPKEIQISVKLTGSAGKYTGQVMIGYKDNGAYRTGKFLAQNMTVPAGVSHGHTGKNYGEYNRWFNSGSTAIFHGFFQDSYGAILLIVDGGVNLGDGGGVSSLSGEIWFKNFYVTPAPQGMIPCWFIELGPYDCRTFLTDAETLNTTSAIYPDQSLFYTSSSTHPAIPSEPARGWRRLGVFSNLQKTKAFGN